MCSDTFFAHRMFPEPDATSNQRMPTTSSVADSPVPHFFFSYFSLPISSLQQQGFSLSNQFWAMMASLPLFLSEGGNQLG